MSLNDRETPARRLILHQIGGASSAAALAAPALLGGLASPLASPQDAPTRLTDDPRWSRSAVPTSVSGPSKSTSLRGCVCRPDARSAGERCCPPIPARAPADWRRNCAWWAVNVGRTETALGAFYRRLAARIGKAKAVTATARKLAILFYRTMRFDMQYQDPGVDQYEQRYRERVVRQLERRAARFGFTLQPAAEGVS
ncbi:hypothetical protein ACSFA7_00315 [Variovorax sp. LT1R20]|uniref:hypothetical protein n=1 Tax=Variovorax sp. LT1R20 TaxID=3443729 RepID=UPI003F474124